MSEPVAKERPSIDLDDFERRLRQQDHRNEDPLAELARLVGENHDPYGDVFAQEAVAQAQAHDASAYRQSGRHEPAFAAPGMSPRLSGDFAAIEAGLRGALSAHPEPDLHADAASHEFYAQNQLYAQDGDPYAAQDQAYLQDHENQQWAEAPPAVPPAARSRRPVYAMVATIAVGVIGIGVAFAYKGPSSSPSEIRTIAAASGPNKIQPPAEASNDGGSPDSGTLGKTGQPAPTTRLVSGEEQPVDISQAVQENNSRNADAGGSQGDASSVPVPPPPGGQVDASATPSADQMPSFGMSGMPAPKKVKVISVRPDGTILSNDAPPAASMETPRLAAEPSDGTRDVADPIAKASTPKTAKSAKPKTTSRVAAKPMQIARADDDASDTPAPKPTRKAKPLHVASAEETPAADPAAGDSAPTASVSPKSSGGFAVQLAAPGSESEARSASSRLAKKFANALDGRRLGFHKAQSNGKSVFRVRVGSLSREDANSLCEKLKADGGSCFVAKNN